jgi:hypothetical protein
VRRLGAKNFSVKVLGEAAYVAEAGRYHHLEEPDDQPRATLSLTIEQDNLLPL